MDFSKELQQKINDEGACKELFKIVSNLFFNFNIRIEAEAGSAEEQPARNKSGADKVIC